MARKSVPKSQAQQGQPSGKEKPREKAKCNGCGSAKKRLYGGLCKGCLFG